eukprot:CAMPEP_0197018512 /NCGR_PEP_ID=MMETSP1380-20130617/80143_1 /TAXON_ID=5936 /ORGANISM="Euplotes crassus, Strain CT5" /LENGTH=280 /DNA_ID=CAMNT_0042445739 /DNA_START=271 /DNA_END=1113 /DNA_ORIENTATION=-
MEDLENELSPWSYIQATLHDLFMDPKKIPSYSKALRIHFLDETPDYEETLELEDKDLAKVKLITGSIRKDTNHQDIDVELGNEKRVSVSKKLFNIRKDTNHQDIDVELGNEKRVSVSKKLFNFPGVDEPVKSQSNESSPQRSIRAKTIFENLLDEKEEFMPNLNQEPKRKHTFISEPDKLLKDQKSVKIEEGKYEIDIAGSHTSSSHSLEDEVDLRETPYWKRREIADGSLYQDILQSNIEEAILKKVKKFEQENRGLDGQDKSLKRQEESKEETKQIDA